MSNATQTTGIKIKLTEKMIDDLEPTGSIFRVWDSANPNFGVIVSAHGVKSYFVQRRVPGLKHPKRMVLGRCCEMSLAQAQEASRRGSI